MPKLSLAKKAASAAARQTKDIKPSTVIPISRSVREASTGNYGYGGMQDQQQMAYKRSMAQQLKREWKPGDVYAPHDLSAAEQRKWGKRNRPTQDVFDILKINPLTLYKNFSVMSDYVSDMGRIRPRSETGLRPVNQRKIAKAVRRAMALGLMPSVHKHPEILKIKMENSGSLR